MASQFGEDAHPHHACARQAELIPHGRQVRFGVVQFAFAQRQVAETSPATIVLPPC